MAEKSFVMVSLKEDKAKKLTQVLSNETSRKILDFLSNRTQATESEIAKGLDLAMSTVHYNLKQLKDNKLVTADEFHYSEKGKEIIHYKIANKYIIIAPDDDEGFLEKLKKIIPAFVVVAATSLIIFLTQKVSFSSISSLGASKSFAADMAMNEVVQESAKVAVNRVAEEGAPIASAMIADSASHAVANETINQTPVIINQIVQAPPQPNIAIWFFVGGMVAMAAYIIWEYIRSRKK